MELAWPPYLSYVLVEIAMWPNRPNTPASRHAVAPAAITRLATAAVPAAP